MSEQTCPKCSGAMSALKSIPPQDRCVNQSCRWIVVTGQIGQVGKGNRTRGPRPYLVGKTGRTKPGRPAGSGRPRLFIEPVSLTILVEKEDRDFWRSEADACNVTLSEYIRDSVNNKQHFKSGGPL